MENTYRITATPNTTPSISLLTMCLNCNFNKQLPVPQLDKKAIYLDHCWVDDIGKVRTKKKIDHAEKYEKLDRKLSLLVKSQLVVCPTSTFHDLETSYLDLDHRKRTQRAAESLACETKFIDPDSIVEKALIHTQDEKSKVPFIDKILYGERNCWYVPRFVISLQSRYTNGAFRKNFAAKINVYLKKEKRSFDDVLNELINDHIRLVLRNTVKKLFEKNDYSLNSTLKDLPIFRIMAALLVELSHDFADGGRSKNIDTGEALDIIMVAHTLPYVDAILVDQGMHTCLNKSKHIPEEYKKRVYSMKGIQKKYDINAFMLFLNSIDTPEYTYPPFTFTHEQLVNAYYEKSNATSPLSQIKRYMTDSSKNC